MGWISFTDSRGRAWSFNAEAGYALVRANIRAQRIRERTTVRVTDHGWFLPTTRTVETDFSGLRGYVDSESLRWWNDVEQRLTHLGPEQALGDLVRLRGETRNRTREVEDMQRTASRATAESIQSVVDNLDGAATVLEFVRDASAATLVAGATILSGGAAAAALTAGSGLKGIGRYQDNGNVGSAIIEAAGSMVVGVVGFGAAAPGAVAAQRYALVFAGSAIDASLEAGKSLIEGNTARVAFNQAVARFGTGVISGGLPVDRMALGAAVRLGRPAAARGIEVGANAVVGRASDVGVGRLAPAGPGRNAGPRLGPAPPVRGVDFAAAAAQALSDEAFVRANILTPGLPTG